MARLKLRQETFDEVVDLLLPLMNTEADRRGLLFWAFGNNKAVLEHLNYGGQAREFVEYLVGYLCAYGEVDPGVQALWMLMVTARDQVGEPAQKRIDALFPSLQRDRRGTARETSLEALYGEDSISQPDQPDWIADEDSDKKQGATRDAKGLFEEEHDEAEVSQPTGMKPGDGSTGGAAPGSGGSISLAAAEPVEKPSQDYDVTPPESGVEKGPALSEPKPVATEAGPVDGERRRKAEEAERKEPLSSPVPSKPPVPTEDVRFTAYFPKEVFVETWYTLLVYTYVDKALEQVRADAAKFKNELGLMPREMHSRAPAQLTRGTEITITPACEGILFNPERITVRWLEDVHRSEFRFKAGQEVAGMASNGLITISVGPVIIATIKMAFLFEEAAETPALQPTVQEVTTQVYKQDQIFLSYSHTDTAIVVACRNAYRSLGFKPLIDIDELRSGENWNDELMRMIDRADIFQLFWSTRSAQSKYVQQEWEYALKKAAATRGEGFIRPVYWEKPLVNPPDALGHLHFAFMPLAKLDET